MSERRDATTATCIACNRAPSSENAVPKSLAALVAADMSLLAGDGAVIVRTVNERPLSALAECELIAAHAAPIFRHSSGLAAGY